MSFRFTLAPVLKLRQSLEEVLLRRLERTQLEISQTLQLLDGLKAHVISIKTARERELAAGLSGADLQIGEDALHRLRKDGLILQSKLAQLRVQRTEQLAEYEDARNKRQVLSDLCDQRRSQYEKQVSRRQQQTSDDSFLARRRRG